jgi:hypothetical protein
MCLKGMSRGVVVLQRDRRGLGGDPTSLPWIPSCHHIERYSRGGLDPGSCKVGPTGRPTGPTWQGAVSYGVHMVRG